MNHAPQTRRAEPEGKRPPGGGGVQRGAPAGVPAFAEPVQRQNLEGGEPPTPGPRAKPTTEKHGAAVHAAADRGLAGAGEPLPHRERIQESFGRHDISRVKARVGGSAGEAAADMDARAFTRGSDIGFRSAPDTRLAAHEAAHVVQQQRGVQFEGGVGRPGDPYERQADEAADAAARGASAEAILDRDPGGGGGEPAGVQAKCAKCGGGMPEEEAPVQAQCASCAAEEAAAPVQMALAITDRSALLGGGEQAGGEGEAEAEPEGEASAEEEAAEGEEEAEAEGETEEEAEPDGGDETEAAEEGEGGEAPAGDGAAAGGAPAGDAGAEGEAESEAEADEAESDEAESETDAETDPEAARETETEPRAAAPAPPSTAAVAAVAAGPPALDSPPDARVQMQANAASPAPGDDAPVQMAPERSPEAAASCDVIDHPVEKPPEDQDEDERPDEPEGGDVDEDVDAEEDEGNPADEQPCEEIAAEGEQATAETATQAEAAGGGEGAGEGEGGEASSAAEEAAGEGGGPEGEAAPEGEGGGGGGGGGGGEGAMAGRIAEAEAARAESVAVSETAAADVETAAAAPGDIRALAVTFSGPDEDRAPAEAALTGFFTGTAARLDEATAFARDGIPARIGAATEAATAAIESEGARQRAAIEARIEAAHAAIEAGAQAASGRVDAAHVTATANIEAATTGALEQVDAAYEEASARIPEMHEAMVEQLETTYDEAEQAYRDVGTTRAATARATGAAFASTYRDCKIHETDGFWEGHLTDRRAEAAAKAAEQTAKGYADNFVETANKQAGKVRRGLPKDKHTARCTAEQIQQNIDTQYEQTVERIRAAHESAIAGADAQRDAAQAQIAAKRDESIAALDAQKPGQLRAVRETTYMQIVAAEQLAHAAAGALQEGITGAATGLNEAMAALAESLQGTPAPTADGLEALLAGATAQRDDAIARLQSSTEDGLARVDGNLLAHTDTATAQLGDLGTSTREQIGQLEQGSTEAIDAIASGAEQGLAEHAERHAESVQGMADGIVESFQTLVDTLQDKYDELLQSLSDTFGEATKSLEESFDDALKQLGEKIPVEASDAASHEPPAWKTVVKWILVIAITIVIAFVAGPAAVGFLAGYGMSTLAAGVIAGAVLGAVAGGLNQVISNWETNRRWDEGLGRAIAMGALTGAVGGLAGGLVSGGISKVLAEGMRRTVVDFAANIVLDAAMDLGFQLAANGWDFDKINWTDFAIGLGMSIAMNGVQARVQHGSGPRPPGDTPDATPPRPVGDTPDATPTRPAGDGPDATPPKPGDASDGTPTRPAGEDGPTPPRSAGDTPAPDGTPPKKGIFERLADFQQKMYQRGEAAGQRLRGDAPDADAPRPVDEMRNRGEGDETPNLDRDPDAPARTRTDEELLDATTLADVDGDTHNIAPRRFGEEVKLFACSNQCAPITQKIDDALAKLPPDAEIRPRLEDLRKSITDLEARIDKGEVSSRDIVNETNRVAQELAEIGRNQPDINDVLNRPAQVDETEVRNQHADEWGVDPTTGKHDPNATIAGLSPAQVDALARQPAVPGEPRVVFRRRRYLEAGGTEPMAKWLERGFRANVNRDISSPHETGALAATGSTPNNAAGNRLEHTHTESVDSRGRPVDATDPEAVGTRTTTTRPDGTRPNSKGGLDIIEHKHLMEGESVLHDSQQLRAQRELATQKNGTTELILSSSAPLVDGRPPVQPSATVGNQTGRIYFYDTASGRVTHQWTTRGWRRLASSH